MEAPGFWDDADKSQAAMKELKSLKDSFEKYSELEQGMEDIETLIQMADEENDASLIPEVEECIRGGRMPKGTELKSLIILKVMKRVLKRLQ